jgi:hypothetical protein
MCFNESGYEDGECQKDWGKLSRVILGQETTIPLVQMMLKRKQEHVTHEKM